MIPADENTNFATQIAPFNLLLLKPKLPNRLAMEGCQIIHLLVFREKQRDLFKKRKKKHLWVFYKMTKTGDSNQRKSLKMDMETKKKRSRKPWNEILQRVMIFLLFSMKNGRSYSESLGFKGIRSIALIWENLKEMKYCGIWNQDAGTREARNWVYTQVVNLFSANGEDLIKEKWLNSRQLWIFLIQSLPSNASCRLQTIRQLSNWIMQ